MKSRFYPPTGVWADFEHDLSWWKLMDNLSKQGLIPPSEVPPKPEPADYSDINAEKTRS